MRARRIVIAGAGIGGLTAALALAARGFPILIVEKASELKPVGAGVQLSPNAGRVLAALELHDALASRATQPSAVNLNSVRAGGEVARLPLVQAADAPYWVMHRADLQAALLSAVQAHPAIELRPGATITRIDGNDDGATLALAAETVQAAALIGADGVGSQVRRTLFPASAARFSGRIAWRGMIERTVLSEVNLWMGPHAHLVAYPVAGGARANLVVTLPGEAIGTTGSPGAAIAERLASAGWPAAPRALIAAAETLTPYPLFTVPPLPAWSAGRIALLGDAAHAMLPFAAQGAAMAIEDAAVLAQCVGADMDDLSAAFARYGALRRPRLARVAKAAVQSGRIYHMDGAMAAARDLTIRLIGGRLLLRRQSWIYDWRP